MPQILTLTATLTSLTSLSPVDTPENPFWWAFTVTCTSCRDTHPTPISMTRHESQEVPGSKGTAHLVWRCKNCKRQHTASVVSFVGVPTKGVEVSKDKLLPAYEARDPATRQKVLEVDGRGLEIEKFHPELGGEWEAVNAESGSRWKVKGEELGEGEWFEYDDKSAAEVSITDVAWEVRRNV